MRRPNLNFLSKQRALPLIAAVLGLLALFGSVYGWYWWQRQDSLSLSGLVQAKEVRNGSQFGGRVKAIHVQEGDQVKAGAPLVVFDASELASKIDEAKATLSEARAQQSLLTNGADRADLRQAAALVRQAEERLRLLSRRPQRDDLAALQAKVREAEVQSERANTAASNAQTLLQSGIISQQRFDTLAGQAETASAALTAARAALRTAIAGAKPEEINIARADVTAARARYEKLLAGAKPGEVKIASAVIDKAQTAVSALQSKLQESVVRAPIDGTVSILNANLGELVPPGRPVVSLIDYRNLWADLYVPESKLDYINVGDSVPVTTPTYPKARFQGRVSFISPKSEFVPGATASTPSSEESYFRVKVTIENRDQSGRKQLQPGMKVNVHFGKSS